MAKHMHDLIILENMESEEVYIEHKQLPYHKNITPVYACQIKMFKPVLQGEVTHNKDTQILRK